MIATTTLTKFSNGRHAPQAAAPSPSCPIAELWGSGSMTAQTLTDREYQRMRDASVQVIRQIGVETGGSNIQFAVNPKDGRLVVEATVEGDLDNLGDIADRVRTLEGSLDITRPSGGVVLVQLWLPVDRVDQDISEDAPALGG